MQCCIFSMAYIFWFNECGQFFCLWSCHLHLSSHTSVQLIRCDLMDRSNLIENPISDDYSRTFHFDSSLKAFVKQWIHSMPVKECSQLSSLIDGILPTGLLWGGRAWNVLTFPVIPHWALDMFCSESHGRYLLENSHKVSNFSCPGTPYDWIHYRVYSKSVQSYCVLALLLQSFSLYWCVTFCLCPQCKGAVLSHRALSDKLSK